MFDKLKSFIPSPKPKGRKGKGKPAPGKGGKPGAFPPLRVPLPGSAPKPGLPPFGKGRAPIKPGGIPIAPLPPRSPAPLPGSPMPGGSGMPPRPPVPQGLSLDRRLDILGIALVAVGGISLLSLFSAEQSPILAAWLNLLKQVSGWGVYGLPLAFIGVGLWLILRKFGDKLPKFEPERLTGLVLLYLALLGTLHFATPEVSAPRYLEFFDFASAGQGGGLVGAVILWGLFTALGSAGSAVLLGAWWVIAVIFAAGLSVPELVVKITQLIQRFRKAESARGDEIQLLLPDPRAAKPRPAGQPSPEGGAAPETALTPKSASPTGPAPAAGAAVPSPTPQPIILGQDPAPFIMKPWVLPKMQDLLELGDENIADDEVDRKRVQVIEGTLASFGAPVKVVEINRGPTITQYGVEPDYVEMRGGKKTKVKVGKIAALADDLALALSAQSIRIEAPVPGKGYVGIEVPNVESTVVALRDVMEAESFGKLKSRLRLGLGQDVSGNATCADLAQMPHLLIAGTTGSGKSVCVNSIIACLLLENTPDDLRLMMVDPKRVELTGYNGIPHLLSPVVVDLERVVASLQWVTREMDERYRKFAKAGVRNINDYNTRVVSGAIAEKRLPYLVVIIDELADLMMLAPDETERTITRLAQLARATGIHLVIATQRPSVDVVTGLIKANFPARIAFAVASSVDSRVILDQPGAERLLGRGDMLFQSPDAAAPLRMQGVFVSDHELHQVVQWWKEERFQRLPPTQDAAPDESAAGALHAGPEVAPAPRVSPVRQPPLPEMGPLVDIIDFESDKDGDGDDDMLEEAIKAVKMMKKASISSLQRHLRIGYTRAARIMDELEERGIVGPAKPGAQQREVIGIGDGTIDPTKDEPPPAPAKQPPAPEPASGRGLQLNVPARPATGPRPAPKPRSAPKPVKTEEPAEEVEEEDDEGSGWSTE